MNPLSTTLAQFESLSPARLDEVAHIEQSVHAHPWGRRNFADCLEAGYECRLLCGEGGVLGYFVAMQGVGEVHLLNITVAQAHQGQGWGGLLLDALVLWAQGMQAQWLWLEVRQSNQRAQAVYRHYGMQQVGLRKDYYPAANGAREHAVVMSLNLTETTP
jgi:ribosomal-protein-alanine N-acetyltransferase